MIRTTFYKAKSTQIQKQLSALGLRELGGRLRVSLFFFSCFYFHLLFHVCEVYIRLIINECINEKDEEEEDS